MSLFSYFKSRRDASSGGQVLVLVAAGLVVFLGFAGLVTDLGVVYANQREARSLSDAAALAGAQELQLTGTRTVTSAQYTRARTVAMQLIVHEVAPSSPIPACGYTADFVNCSIPGTSYTVSIATPSPICVDCDAERAVRVTVSQSDIPAFFSRLFGRDTWTVRQTSVAGISYEAKYAVITLRPPRPLPSSLDANRDDIDLNGTGTMLSVPNADIGTNTNLVQDGGALTVLGPGYKVHYYDSGPAWTGAPDGKHINKLIEDPNYNYPSRTSLPTFNNQTSALAAVTAAECLDERNKLSNNYLIGGVRVNTLAHADPGRRVYCYKPGIYTFRLDVANNDAALLMPGVYFFDGGVRVREALIGGYEAGQPGVTLVFRECNASCILDGNNASIISLNAGSKFGNPSGTEATAAVSATGQVMQADTDPPLLMSIMVTKAPGCSVPTSAPFIEPTTCDNNANQTLNMAGGGNLYLAGVQYAPTDNIAISGGSSGVGFVGQIVGWTVKYSGGTQIQQSYPGQEGNGILRLDEACSGSGPDSMSNPLCTP